MTTFCPVCTTEVPPYRFEHPNGARVECLKCGTYRLMEEAGQRLIERRVYVEGHRLVPNHRLSAALRERAERGEEPVLRDPDAMERTYRPAADPLEVIDRILMYLRSKASDGNSIKFVPLNGQRDHGVAGAPSPEAFDHALGQAAELDLVKRKALDEAAYRLTLAGWKHLRGLPDVERKDLLPLADQAMRVLYDQEIDGRYSAEKLIDALGVDEARVARALRYAEKQGWITTQKVFGGQMPVDVSVTREGMQYTEGLPSTRSSKAATPNAAISMDQVVAAPASGQQSPDVNQTPAARPMSRRVFVVHGHDEGAKNSVAYVLGKLQLEPVILHEQASGGRTLLEKLMHYTDEVAFAAVILTPDDVGASRALPSDLKPRARQNVILELGLLIGKLGRGRVCALVKGDVERPSDIAGVVYVDMDDRGAWKSELGRELRNAQIEIDLNRL